MTPKYIILHCSDTKDSGTVSWQAIRRYHMETNGWSDLGYHFGIELVGDEYEILVGRPLDRAGAHCSAQRMNHQSFGICCIGAFDESDVPLPQWQQALKLVKSLQRLFGIPTGKILGHREVDDRKTCPGNRFNMSLFRAQL